MEYYIIDGLSSQKDIFINDTNYPTGIYDLILEGRSFLKKLEGETIYMDYKLKNGRKTDWVNGIQSLDIISEEFKSLIETESIDLPFLEFYPVILRHKESVLNHNYYCLNVLESINAFDWENSIYTIHEGTDVLDSVDKLVLDISKIGDRNIFRIGKIRPILFVSEVLKKKIELASLTGLTFMKTEEFVKF